MSKVLVAYFSASGVTKKVATRLAEEIGAELFEIVPETPYTAEDLNWQDKNSRSQQRRNQRCPGFSSADCRLRPSFMEVRTRLIHPPKKGVRKNIARNVFLVQMVSR